jgi:hypothetical protein
LTRTGFEGEAKYPSHGDVPGRVHMVHENQVMDKSSHLEDKFF